MIKKKSTRLSLKAYIALKEIYDFSFKKRVNKLEQAEEYSFSILLYWNRIEMLIKILKYHHKIDNSYPDRLNFINRSWGILKNLNSLDSKKYQVVFGDGKKTKECLWCVRDKIVHANYTLTKHEYEVFKEASKRAFEHLFTNMPETYDLARKQYLEHRRKYDRRARQ